MAKTNVQKANVLPFIAIIIVLILVVIGLGYLYVQTNASYSSANSNYTALQTRYNTQGTQLNTANSDLSSLSTKYNTTEYNLTHPYTSVLYNQQTTNLARYNESNYTYNSALGIYYYNVTWGSVNYSFNVPYPGYLIFNGTSTVPNNPSPSTCAWQVYVSNKLGLRNISSTFTGDNAGYIYKYAYRYQGADELFINLTSTPFVELCPVQSVTYIIPVATGKNHLLINNDNASGITITFSAKYVGFHTS